MSGLLGRDTSSELILTPLSVGAVRISEKPVHSLLVGVVYVLCVLARVDVVLPERCLAVHKK